MDSETASSLFKRLTSQESLMSTFSEQVEKKSARGRDGVSPALFRENLNFSCEELSRKLRSGEHEFTQYRELLKSKGAGKPPRVVSVPTVRDRVALRAVAEVLGRVYPEFKGSIPQAKVQLVKEALELGTYDSFIRLDVKEFYPNISHERVIARLRWRVRKKELLSLILKAIKTPTVPDRAKKKVELQGSGVPQGLAISNILAELVARPIDVKMQADERCFYVRFVDDVLILCHSSDVDSLKKKAGRLFQKEHLEVHDPNERGGKSGAGSISEGFEYLGYRFFGTKISVRFASVHKVESSLARAFTRYAKSSSGESERVALARCQWKANLIITGCIYKNTARGWVFYFRQVNDLTVLKNLDMTVKRFAARFNLPDTLKVKTFMRTYWQIRSGQHALSGNSYVPNFDLISIDEMRVILSEAFAYRNIELLSDKEVEFQFNRLAGKAIAELEEDIGDLS
ncbi:reverse transcriptase domain-containing protein [Allokutzneria sp. A3M-2-11 16]|uniref:reverse transcriptase domain-containing protein n=1 Tax=Allokutzneria sp. A3M-2-11 16 TaxID=2962043 RepID=UPI0020B78749|nr:reverse transcriptase domain-containing protein [Allokutzneria sp. A3M-2-11 16]MCP3804955.1 reverse transcriptase domain-containing protein [Allokutzneria sp. A3M-2-11 16]